MLEILPDQCFVPAYLNFYEYEMLTEREFELAYILLHFLNNRQQPASD